MASIEGLTALADTLRVLSSGEVLSRGRTKQKLGGESVSVIVGYETAYALFVHENIEMKGKGKPRHGPSDPGKSTGKLKTKKQVKWFWGAVSRGEIPDPRPPGKGNYWDPRGEAKFLEKPARRLSRDGTVGKIVRAVMAAGGTLEDGLVAAGMEIQSVSQELAPVDTGVLKNSAFTKVEGR